MSQEIESRLVASRNRRRNSYLALTGLVAVVLLSFVKAIESQVSRLRAPDTPPFSYSDLHGGKAKAALKAFDEGRRALADAFHPVSPRALIMLHAGVALICTALLTLLAFRVIARLGLHKRLRWAVGALAGLAVATALQDMALCAGIRPSWFGPAFSAFTFLKVLVILGMILFLVVDRYPQLGEVRRLYRDAPATARLVLFAAVGFTLLLQFSDIGAQCEDMLRREFDQGVLAVGRLLLELLVYLFAVYAVSRIALPAGKPPKPRKLLAGGAVAAVAGSVVALSGGMSGLAVLGFIAVAIAIAPAKADPSDGPSKEGSGRALYALAAVLPAAGLTTVAGRLFAGEVSTGGGWVLAGLAATSVAVLAAGVAAGWACLLPTRPVDESSRSSLRSRIGRSGGGWSLNVPLVALAGAPLAVAAVGLVSPDAISRLGRLLSAFGVLLLGLTAFTAVCGSVRLLLADLDKAPLFDRLGMLRTPVVGLLLLWFAATTAVGARFEKADSSPHVVRTLSRLRVDPKPCPAAVLASLAPRDHEKAVAGVLCQWLEANALATGRTASSDPVPLVLATASGGGVRAAAWTARVLDCLFLPHSGEAKDPCGEGRVGTGEPNPFRYLFAAGGASGGSVGIMSAVAQSLAPAITDDISWVRALGNDHVGPLLSQAVLGELLLSPVGLHPGRDRAEVLIDGWSEPFGVVGAEACAALAGATLKDVGFLQLRSECPGQVPLMLFNGTVVRSGQRFNISPLDGSMASVKEREESWTGGSVDLLDVLCPDQDIPVMDAAFLSARFPFATPSGRFLEAGGDCTRDITSGVDVVDGGYLENSGTAQIGELYDVLGPLLHNYATLRPAGYRPVKVVLVRIENGERSGEPEKPPALSSQVAEPLRVPQAQLGVMGGGGRSKEALDSLRTALARDGATMLEFALHAHPGRRLPLGWALTKSIFEDIDNVFTLPGRPAREGGIPTALPGNTESACLFREAISATGSEYRCPVGAMPAAAAAPARAR